MIKTIGRFFRVLGFGFVASLIGIVMMAIYYGFIRYGNISGLAELQKVAVVVAIVGLIIGIATQAKRLRTKTASPAIAIIRILATTTIFIFVSIMIWYYFRVEYFRLKDDGPQALIVGLVLALCDLLSATKIEQK